MGAEVQEADDRVQLPEGLARPGAPSPRGGAPRSSRSDRGGCVDQIDQGYGWMRERDLERDRGREVYNRELEVER